MKTFDNDEELNRVKRVKEGSIQGIIGIINLEGKNYLVTIKQAEKVATLNRSNIMKVTKVRFHSLAVANDAPMEQSTYSQLLGAQKTPYVERSILEDLRFVLEDGFYFSYGYDVTCSRQRRN